VKQRLITIVLVVAAVGAVAWFYASPYVVVERVRRAAARGDSDTVSRHVDFGALRQSVKEALRGAMARAATKPDARDTPFAGLGIVFSASVGDALVDQMITPDGVRRLLAGRLPRPGPSPEARKPAEPKRESRGEDKKGEGRRRPPQPEMHYEAWDRFAIDFKNPRRPPSDFTLVWQRRGLSWMLVGLRVPQPRS
jgi:hypothetical protein